MGEVIPIKCGMPVPSCTAEGCRDRSFAWVSIAPGQFRGHICEKCFNKLSPKWFKVIDNRIAEFLSKEEQ